MNSIKELYEKLHSFEDNEEVLGFTLEFCNVPMWPLIRIIIILCIEKKIGCYSERKRENMIIRKNIVEEFTKKNPFFSLPKDVIYVGFTNDDMLQHEDGLLYDERYKSYVEISKKASILISVISNDKFDYAYSNWKSDYFIHYLAHKKENISEKDILTANRFIEFLNEKLPFEMGKIVEKNILNTIMQYSKWLPGYVEAWKLYLRIVRPKLVIICEGCYLGIPNVGMNLACEDFQIPTAEFQHAWEGKTTRAHYWGNKLIQNKNIKRIFPDFFLTYGKYWNDRVNIPCKKVVVGTHRKYKESVQNRNQNVLICLSVNCEQYINLVDVIMKDIGLGNKVYLRLHPLGNTKSTRALFEKFKGNSGFEFANDKKIEYYFEHCKYVVTSGSTVVYEALTCGKVVFVPKDQLYELSDLDTIYDKIFSFRTLQQFEELWDRRRELPAKIYSDFYDMSYKELYSKFIRRITGKKQKKIKERKKIYE